MPIFTLFLENHNGHFHINRVEFEGIRSYRTDALNKATFDGLCVVAACHARDALEPNTARREVREPTRLMIPLRNAIKKALWMGRIFEEAATVATARKYLLPGGTDLRPSLAFVPEVAIRVLVEEGDNTPEVPDPMALLAFIAAFCKQEPRRRISTGIGVSPGSGESNYELVPSSVEPSQVMRAELPT